MTYHLINYHFNFILFLLLNAVELGIETFLFILVCFGKEDYEGNMDVTIKWKFKHTIMYVIIILGIAHMLVIGGFTRLFTIDGKYTQVNEIGSIEFDGNRYTVNDNILVDHNKAWYSDRIDKSVVVEYRNHVCWIAGISKYVTSYMILFSKADYNKFFSEDIKWSEFDKPNLARFVYSKYNIEVASDDFGARTAMESRKQANTKKNPISTSEEKDEKSEDIDINEQAVDNSILNDLNKNLSSINDNINNINKNVEEQRKELDKQKQEIEELKNKKEPMDNSKVIAIIVGIALFWLMGLITIVTFIKIKTHSKKELILTASDAKIREGVMLDDDK